MWLGYLHRARLDNRADDVRDIAAIIRTRFEADTKLKAEAESELARIDDVAAFTGEALLQNRDYIGSVMRGLLRTVLSDPNKEISNAGS